MKKFIRTILAATTVLLALTTVACKQNPENSGMADLLDGKVFYIYSSEIDPAATMSDSFIMLEKNETDPNGNTLSINFDVLFYHENIKIIKTGKSTYKLTGGEYTHEISPGISTYVYYFNGEYNSDTNELKYEAKVATSADDKTVILNNKTVYNSTLELDNLNNLTYVDTNNIVYTIKNNKITVGEDVYLIDNAVLTGYNEYVLSHETENKKLFIRILDNFKQIKFKEPVTFENKVLNPVNTASLVTIDNFLNKRLTAMDKTARSEMLLTPNSISNPLIGKVKLTTTPTGGTTMEIDYTYKLSVPSTNLNRYKGSFIIPLDEKKGITSKTIPVEFEIVDNKNVKFTMNNATMTFKITE